MLTAGINAVKTLFPGQPLQCQRLSDRRVLGRVLLQPDAAWLLIAAGLGAALLLRRALDVLALGEETAQGLGLHVKAVRFGLLVVASVLAGARSASPGCWVLWA